MRGEETVAILEAAYRVEQPQAAWLKGVFEVIAPHIDAGLGASAYFVDLSRPDEFRTWAYQGTGLVGGRLGRTRFAQWNRMVPVEFKRHVHLFGPCGTGRRIPPLHGIPDAIKQSNDAHGLADMFGLNAIDASGQGCALASALPKEVRRNAPRYSERMWGRIAAHLAAAARIGRTLKASRARLNDRADAIVSPGGRIVHAEGDARKVEVRQALRDAAIRIDKTRSRHARLDGEQVTELWQALVAQRWSLVDHFDHDGRRYFIANANVPSVPTRQLLSEREAQVVGAASLGHSNKNIAYELGISASSVATHLSRATEKLGVSSRAELIRAFVELARRAPPR